MRRSLGRGCVSLSMPPPPSSSLSSASTKLPFLIRGGGGERCQSRADANRVRARAAAILNGRSSARACSAAPFDWAVEHVWTAPTTGFAYAAAAGIAAVAIAAAAAGVVAVATADRTRAAVFSAACVAVRSGPREIERMVHGAQNRDHVVFIRICT
ncbi:hypothetical protein DFH11DRAFT_1644368 [Phellopilus nigrolimitatus]|nr:hypothetical protein DFH11DRAFT_1644368 [Phellopilus nigrolimitatus]